MQSTFTIKQSTTTEILPILESDNIWSMLPESGNEIRSAQILATKLIVFQPSGQNGRI
jgi:hypothetical protein